jgi:putative flippase GtrA
MSAEAVLRARRHERRLVVAQVARFGVVGATGYLVNLVVFISLSGDLGLHRALAGVGAFCVAVTSNFAWNRLWTFGPGKGSTHLQAARFLLVSLGCLAINLCVLELLTTSTPVGDVPAQAIAVAFAMPFNFICNKLWTFA